MSEKALNKRFFKGTGVVLAGIEHSQKSLIFASGIPVQDRVVFRHDQLKITDFYAFAHFFKAIGQLCYKLHFNIEVYRQIGVLVRRVYRLADEEVNIGSFLKKQAADKRSACRRFKKSLKKRKFSIE